MFRPFLDKKKIHFEQIDICLDRNPWSSLNVNRFLNRSPISVFVLY